MSMYRYKASRITRTAVIGVLGLTLTLTLAVFPHAEAGALPVPSVVAAHKALSVCMDPTFPPMEFFKTASASQPTGFDVDLATQVATLWHVKLAVRSTQFTGLLPALGANRCDFIISGIFVTPARTKVFRAVPYMITRRVLVVKGGNPAHIHSPNDLAGKTVAVEAGTSYVTAFDALDKALRAKGKAGLNIQTYPGQTDADEQILVGRAVATMTQDTEYAYRAISSPGRFAIAYVYPAHDTFGIYYRPHDSDIGPDLLTALRHLRANGTLARLLMAWHLPASAISL